MRGLSSFVARAMWLTSSSASSFASYLAEMDRDLGSGTEEGPRPREIRVARTLILDSEALNALARASERPALAHRGRADPRRCARRRSARSSTGAGSCGGLPWAPGGCRCTPGAQGTRGSSLSIWWRALPRRAGALLARARLGSTHAVDAVGRRDGHRIRQRRHCDRGSRGHGAPFGRSSQRAGGRLRF